MPQISVIVPVYKVEQYLHRCVDSILAQTFTDFELILVDDGSPDNCGAICDEYAQKDSRVVVIHQPNGGLSAARNAGIDWAFANSDSEWLFFVDSDDWIHKKSLEALLNGARQTGLEVVVGGYERSIGKNPILDEQALQAVVWDVEDYFCGEYNVNAVVAWGKIYSKKCFAEIRYPLGKYHEDEFTTYKILFMYKRIAVIQQPLYAYYQNSDGIMGSTWTPKRLAIVEALEERAHYFRNQDNQYMYEQSLHAMFALLVKQYYYIQQCDSSLQNQYIIIVKRILRQKIKKYWRLVPFKENLGVYERAYPHLTGLYWKIEKIKNR